jgi:hypothetical protein
MLSMHQEYIKQHLLPTIKANLSKYSVWWAFKPNSSLQEYLEEHHIYLSQYFTPEELFNALTNIAESKQMFVYGNKHIIIPDNKLQECLNEWVLYCPELLTHCKNHIQNVVANTSMFYKLQSSKINENIYFESPMDIIFNDPSSLFWIHPDINAAMNQTNKVVYTWKELNDLFLDFCTTDEYHFTRKTDCIFYINPSSVLSKIFKSRCFHRNQIETVLKTVTKYLGKTKTINQYCPGFTTSVTNKDIWNLLDIAISNFNKYIPFMYTYVDI